MRNEKSSKKAMVEDTGNELPKRRRICEHWDLSLPIGPTGATCIEAPSATTSVNSVFFGRVNHRLTSFFSFLPSRLVGFVSQLNQQLSLASLEFSNAGSPDFDTKFDWQSVGHFRLFRLLRLLRRPKRCSTRNQGLTHSGIWLVGCP
jgi:hypothetical protein